MANIKNGSLREIIIDRCLQNRRGYSTMEIMKKCNDALERRCEPLISASNTIRNDILSIENRWHISIETIKVGRNIRYRYKNPDFSIFNSPLTEDEINQLNQAVALLRRFDGMPGFDWIDELNAHIQSTINVDQRLAIGFDENKQLKGMEFFSPLFESINNKITIEIQYQTYKEENPKSYIVYPYYLKEYNQRWFLFALNQGYEDITVFSLDRLKGVRKTSIAFVENIKIDFEHYFDDIIGVSSKKNDKALDIIFKVCKEQLPYIRSKPLHRTQKVLEVLECGDAIISIKVKLNFELIQLLLSFGERITVLKPDILRYEIKQRIEKNLENYQ